MKRVITFGTFDVFHVGHVNILERAKELGDHLIVGISTDALNFNKKGLYPIFDEQQRLQMVNAIYCVDQVFLEVSLEEKADYIEKYSADILVMGDDWAGKFDHFGDQCEVIYLPRTTGISTSEIIRIIREGENKDRR